MLINLSSHLDSYDRFPASLQSGLASILITIRSLKGLSSFKAAFFWRIPTLLWTMLCNRLSLILIVSNSDKTKGFLVKASDWKSLNE
jgi:hypothetical protein